MLAAGQTAAFALTMAASPTVCPAAVRTAEETAAFVFIDLALIVIAARLAGTLFGRIRQPAVIGEILVGLLLGTSLLGQFHHGKCRLTDEFIPKDVFPGVNALAQLGLVIFMFIVGLELDPKLIAGRVKTAMGIAVCAMALPFMGGLVVAFSLYSRHANSPVNSSRPANVPPLLLHESVTKIGFVLFVGMSVSVTAFPVLARILSERGMHRTPLGGLALASAAANDVLAWTMFAIVLAVVKSHASAGQAGSSDSLPLPVTLGATVAFTLVMFLVVKPLLARLTPVYRRAGRLTPTVLAVVLVGVLISAYITDRLGVHFIFGAFLFGAIMPRVDTEALFRDILERLEQFSVLVLLPVFFIVAGRGADVTKLGKSGVPEVIAILAVSILGKVIGAGGAARALGLRPNRAAAIGVLMNTRGLTELVVLNIGRDIGVLDEKLFTILVIMAIVTTFMTEPVLRLVYSDKTLARDVAEVERAALGEAAGGRVLVVVDDPTRSDGLVDAAAQLARGTHAAEVVLSRFSATTSRLEIGTGYAHGLADIAETFGSMQRLQRRVEAAGVSAVVRSQFTDDIGRALLGQAVAVEASLIVGSMAAGGEPDPVLRRLLDDAVCAVGILVEAAGRPAVDYATVPLRGAAGPGADGSAALVFTAELALSGGRPVRLADGLDGRANRRTSALAAALSRSGLDAAIGAPFGSDRSAQVAVWTVVGWEGWQRAEHGLADSTLPALIVRAAAGDDGDSLDELVERIRLTPTGSGDGRREAVQLAVDLGGNAVGDPVRARRPGSVDTPTSSLPIEERSPSP